MRRFKPIHGIVLVVTFVVVVFLAAGGWGHADLERVGPDGDGLVRVDVGDLEPGEVRFYRFLNSGNQEVKFFVGRDPEGVIQTAFDANEICYKKKRGYKPQGEWVICQFCDKAFRLSEVNEGRGGCAPVPLRHRLEGDQAVFTESDMLKGWRFFR
jgi:uncharacterized membrane protein